MAFSVTDLRNLRRYLEALAPGFAALPEARDLYAADAETVPDAALSRFVFKLELKDSYSGAALRAVLPALGKAEVDSVFHKAIREDNLSILQACWLAVPVLQRGQAAAAVPTRRVLTPRFHQDPPRVSAWARAAVLEARIDSPLAARSRSRM